MKLTPGKLAGIKAVSNERGVIAAAAMDQRGSLQKSLAKEKGSAVSDEMMEEFKILVSEVLTPHASAILLDPEWGLPASKHRAAPCVRLTSPDATAESCSARSRGRPCDPASNRPSAETTTAWATPGTRRTKSVMSQPKLPGC